MVIALLAGIGPFHAHALCTDQRNPSVDTEFADSDYVIAGRVLRQRYIRDPSDPQGYVATVYDVAPIRAFKGTPRARLNVRSENTTSRFPMVVGQTYLLFLQPGEKTEWFADNCGNSGEMSQSQPIMPRVLSLQKKRKGK